MQKMNVQVTSKYTFKTKLYLEADRITLKSTECETVYVSQWICCLAFYISFSVLNVHISRKIVKNQIFNSV